MDSPEVKDTLEVSITRTWLRRAGPECREGKGIGTGGTAVLAPYNASDVTELKGSWEKEGQIIMNAEVVSLVKSETSH